jgi:hypothetical protein
VGKKKKKLYGGLAASKKKYYFAILEFLMSIFDKDSSTFGHYAVRTGKLLHTFRGGENILRLFVLTDPENGGITIVQNAGRNLPIDTA